ncbi:glycine/sarcosine/betaine reductase complex component C subunit alpha [Tindallia californiensis]|uniref:Glycine reductase n=1 Tax=Tindallia californiensis TaxID=159292 RepID=A0A1H3I8X9_9FIRM|nr:glycine/sarcosine/betaine reductase complex component C subunit alpha [Tindallia californiensis]SDY24091.1 glycine reductase [Tindallia californiensis]
MVNEYNTRNMMGHLFEEVAEILETGKKSNKMKVGLTTYGCEAGIKNWIRAAENATAQSDDFEVVLIGPKQKTALLQFDAINEVQAHKKMDMMLDHGIIDACITTNYTYPIGVASVGKMTTLSQGKQIFMATTSGTSAINRGAAMTFNALYGVIVAKTMGINNPKVGILNVEGARQVEKGLVELSQRGYPIDFASSMRSEAGCIMRGNDVIAGTPDVLVQDSLTGNITMKMCASFMSGGSLETIGAGYGPGIGEQYDKIAMVISRASAEIVVENAIHFAAKLIRGNLISVAKNEFSKAKKAGLLEIINRMSKMNKLEMGNKSITIPLEEPVNHGIAGIDIMELEQAMQILWSSGIYAESGMGCTGPILLVNEKKAERAIMALKKSGFLVYEEGCC